MKKNVLLQVKVPERVVLELDKLVESGLFRTRSEAVVEGIRRLIATYSLLDAPALFVERYLSGSRIEEDFPEPELDEEEAMRRLTERFGTANADEVLRKMRMRA